jgi:hypothetical protein
MQNSGSFPAQQLPEPADGERIAPSLHADRLNGKSPLQRHAMNGTLRLENQAQPMTSLKQPLGMQQHGVLLSSDRRAGFRDQNIHEGDAIRV